MGEQLFDFGPGFGVLLTLDQCLGMGRQGDSRPNLCRRAVGHRDSVKQSA